MAKKNSLNPGDIVITGTAGNDTFAAPSGSSGIDGRGGDDIVSFAFRLVDATISYAGASVIVDSAVSHTELTGIPIYQFADGTVNLADDHPLVDDLYYYSRYQDVWVSGGDADADFAQSGWQRGRNPNAFFDTGLYLAANPDVAAAGLNPLQHFHEVGWKEGRIPSVHFDSIQYLRDNPDVAAANVDPLAHYLAFGRSEGRAVAASDVSVLGPGGFDYGYYLRHNPDVAAAGVDAYQHFVTFGWREGRDPNAWFDARGYLATYGDVAAAGVNPLEHYNEYGWKEGRNPSPAFDTAAYLAANPDVAAAGVNPLLHYLRFGVHEGRSPVPDVVTDTDPAVVTLPEGAAAGTDAGFDVSWGGWISPSLSFSIASDTSGGGFAVDATTGAIVVADSSRLDFETSGPSHSHMIVVQARIGDHTRSQTFIVEMSDVVPTTPVDGNAAANTVVEGAANGSTVGVTLFSDEPNGPAVSYQLTDDAGGLFAVDAASGVVTLASTAALDFETGAHSFTITGRTLVGGSFTPTQSFTIALTNAAPAPISDSNAAPETVDEGAAANTLVGIDADSSDPNGPAVTLSIVSDSSGGGFQMDANGVISVADPSKIDYESAPGVGHSHTVVVQASDGAGGITTRAFAIVVNNVHPTTPTDGSGGAGGSVLEGAAADTLVGIDADASDINGPAVTWSIVGDTSNGGFKIDAATGVVSVADPGKVDHESAPGAGNSHDITVRASDGAGGFSDAVFNIAVGNVDPDPPTNSAPGSAGGPNVAEGAAVDTTVGLSATSSDPNGTPIAWSIVADDSNGGFKIGADGVVRVADPGRIDYESSGLGRSYDITVRASDGHGGFEDAVFTIGVTNVAPSAPADGDAANDGSGIHGRIAEGGAGAPVGIDADATDPGGPAVTWSILSGTASGGFQIDANTGVVSVLNGALIDYETAPSIGGGLRGHTITVQASDGAGGTSTRTFTIEVANAAPAAPTDADPVGDGSGTIRGIATFDAAAGTLVGIQAQSSGDPAGGSVTYELAAGSSGFFQIDAATGEVSVSAAGQGNLVSGADYGILVVAKDATGVASGTSTATALEIHVQGLAPGNPADADNAGNAIAEDAVTGTYTGLQAVSATAGVTYSISADSSGGGFSVDTDGKVHVANASLIDYESAPGHKYTITVVASDGALTSASSFDIDVLDVAPAQPVDGDASSGTIATPAQGRVSASAALSSNVGITVSAADVDGGALTYILTDNPGSRFAIDASTGVVTLADNIGLAAGAQLTFKAIARSTGGALATRDSAEQTFTVDVVSNQPVVDLNGTAGGGSAGIDFANSFTEGAGAVPIADSDAAVVDPGFANLASATVTLTNAQVGDALAVGTPGGLSVSTVSDGGRITLTLTGSAAFSVYETALRSITFNNASDTPSADPRVVTVVVNDGVNPPSNAATSTISVAATNDAPALNLTLPAAPGHAENAAPTVLATSGVVTDPDLPTHFGGGSYTVEITANASAGDQIVLLASSGFSASGSSIIYGGKIVGTVNGLTALGSAKVTIDLTANATPAVVDALSAAFGYFSSSNAPAASTRTVTFTFDDGGHNGGGGNQVDSETQTVAVTAVNDAPVNSVPAGTQTVAAGGTLVLNAAGNNLLSVTDADAGSSDVTVTLSVSGGTLTLAQLTGLVVNGDGTATVDLTGSLGAIAAALDGLTYTAGAAGTVTLTITSNDGGNTGTDPGLTGTGGNEVDTDTVQIVVTTPTGGGGPQIDLDANDNTAVGSGYATTFTEAASPTPVFVVDTDIQITGSPDSATVTLVNRQAGDDVRVDGQTISGILEYNSGDDVIGFSINTGTPGRVTITFVSILGFPSPNDYQDAFQRITFSNASNAPSGVDRILTFVMEDSNAGTVSNTAVATIHIATVNNAPTLDADAGSGGSDFAASYRVGDPAVAVTGTVDIADVDSTTIASATIVLTNAQAGDVLAINGALPTGITAAIALFDDPDPGDPDTITVTLTGPASLAAFETALQQVVFSTSSSDTTTVRALDIAVDDGVAPSSAAHTLITVSANTAPVAQDDDATATEAGGAGNAVAGSNPSGNVLDDNGNGADSDAEDGAVLVVTQVTHNLTTVAAGTTLIGTYGAVTINADGSYSYAVDNGNASVQALVGGGAALHDQFTYTVRDSFGATDTAVLDITIEGADDFAQAVADAGSMGEDAGATTFDVAANDNLDPDATALNTVALAGSVTAVGNGGASGLGIDGTDVTVVLVGDDIQVTLTGPDFQKLAVGDTATITVPYTLTGDTGQVSAAVNLVITVSGANDLPVANDDTGSMGEDAAMTAFAVLTGAGADALDVDRGAPTASTPGLVTTGTVTAAGNGSAAGKVSGSDVTVGVDASNQVTVSLGANFQRLAAGETATITVAYALHGDGTDEDGATLTVTVNGANDAPVVDLLSTVGVQATGTTATLTENSVSNPVTALAQLTLTDVDTANIGGAVVTLTNPQATDVVSVSGFAGALGTLASGIDFVITGGTTVTFSNVDTAADYQAALRLVQFNNTSEAPVTTNRAFSVQVTDADGAMNAATTATVAVVGVNDAPVNTAPDNLNPFSDTDFAFTGPNTISIADIDAGSGTVRVTLSTAHGDLSMSTAGGASVFTGLQNSHTIGIQGTVTQVNAALATLKYNSDTGYTGLDSITVLTNDQGNSPSPALTDTDVIALGVLPRVWFIDNSVAGSGGDGSEANPFRSIAEFNAASTGAGSNEYVYLEQGTGTYVENDGIHLKNGQTLVGQGESLTFANPLGGPDLTIATGSAGQTPTIQLANVAGADGKAGIDLAQNNTIKGLNVVTTRASQTGIDDGNNGAGASDDSVGTLTISNVDVTGVGKAIDIDEGGTLAVALDKVTSTGSSSQGVDLGGGLSGSFTVADSASGVSGATGVAFNVAGGGSLAVTFNGSIAQASNAALVSVAGGHTGTMTFQNGTLSATSGTGLQFDNADGTYNFNGTNTLNGGDAGIDVLNGSNGSFAFSSSSSIQNASGTDININGGSGNFTYNGTITDDVGQLISVANKAGGTVTFGGTMTDGNDGDGSGLSVSGNSGGTVVNFNGQLTLSTGANAAVSLTSNTGATINFNAAGSGLDITTSSGAGFTATGGGTVTVQGSGNSINAVSATALNVSGTNIGASGLTFQRIDAGNNNAAADPVNGIALSNTGSSGGLTVTGSGTAGSGGTIQNTTSDGVYLNSTINPTLSWMAINDAADNGIFIDAVSGLSLSNLSLASNGAQAEGGAVHDAGIHIGNLIGTSNTISNSSIVDSRNTNLDWDPNASSSMSTLTVTNTTLNHAGGGVASQGNAGLNLVATGSANVKLVVSGGQIVNNAAAGILVTGGSGTTVRTDIDGVDMKSSAPPADAGGASWGNGVGTNFGISLSSTGTAVQRHEITNVELAYTGIAPNDGGSASAIGFLPSGTGSFDITLKSNTIGLAGAARSGNENFFGIAGDIQDSVTVRADISNNTVRNTALNGIFIQTRDPSAAAGTSTTDLTVRNNTVGSISDDDDFAFGAGPNQAETHAIRIEARNDSVLRLDIAGNSADGLGGNQDYLIRQRDTSTFSLERLTGNAADAANIQSFIVGQNASPGGQTARATVATGFTAIANGTVQDPLLPLSAAQGQGPGGFEPLTSAEMAPILARALEHWAAAGVSAEQLAHLDGLELTIADLPDTALASASERGITIDLDAAGWGWFVDPTPSDDSEFGLVRSAVERAASDGAAAGRIDLLTTIMHELGHALGLGHSDVPGGLMNEAAELGIRRLPAAAEAPNVTTIAPFVGRDIFNGFDAEYYLARNPDVAAAGVDPLVHFDTFGWKEGRDPNGYFDTDGYLAHYADVAAAGVNPLQHYVQFGWKEGRDPSAGFDTQGYLAANPDVAASHVDPLGHYLQFGIHEGRAAVADGLWH